MSDIELTAPDGHVLTAHLSTPDGPPRGGVVVIQEIFGVNEHIRAVTDAFAAAGYLAVAPALFDRSRRGVELGYDAEGLEVGRGIAWELPLDEPLSDIQAAAAYLAEALEGPASVATVGFCWGGMLSAAAASRTPRSIAAAVGYYPSMAAQLLVTDQPHVPLLVHLGDLDPRITVEDGQTLAERWPTATFHRYDAGHGFNCNLRPDYSPKASTLAWARTLAFLNEHLTGGD